MMSLKYGNEKPKYCSFVNTGQSCSLPHPGVIEHSAQFSNKHGLTASTKNVGQVPSSIITTTSTTTKANNDLKCEIILLCLMYRLMMPNNVDVDEIERQQAKKKN
jgi:hypothetical protein